MAKLEFPSKTKLIQLVQQKTRQPDRIEPQELDYVDDMSAAMLLKTPRQSQWLLYIIASLVLSALVWAAFAELDEVTRGSGKVIPSQQIQVIQNLEGGILQEIYVSEGDNVIRDQPLLRINDTRFRSDLQEQQQESLFLLASSVRLRAEIDSVRIGEAVLTTENWREQIVVLPQPLVFDAEFGADQSGIREQAQAQYRERLRNMSNQLSIIESEIEQKMHSKLELQSKYRHLKTSYKLGREELKLTQPLADEGVVSRVELLQLKRDVNRQKSDLDSSRLLLPKLESEILQAIYKRRDVALQFREETQGQLSEAQSRLARQNETTVGLEDRVDRTLVVSPVQGTVKRIVINTVGGIIQPGMDLLEIVPTEEQLLVEAKVMPKDIAFLRPGLDAMVRFTAYDFATYGGLHGKVDHISADSIEDEKGDLYYLVRVRTEQTEMVGIGPSMPIIPGMMATIDIVTGQKSVLDYLLKPILRAKQMALTER